MKNTLISLSIAVSISFSALGAAQELTGKYAPTATPALPPDKAREAFELPEGFEMRLFAAEPQVISPVAMSWDERGRLWVVELFEYPLGAAKGSKPRDRIKILEDSDNDGRADKVTVFADGLNLATAILCGNGGAYVGQAPHLYFMKDTDGDDVADVKEIVMTGFGLEDRHELLNGFTWGPDGYLYMTHGVFTHSKVKDPGNPDDDGTTMNAAVARFHPHTRKFEVFGDGTSNPWGVDFDRYGNAFVSACVIEHLFHITPGGQYLRQSGLWANPYGYASLHSKRGGLPSIVDHSHHLAAYAGVQIYQGNQYPADYLGTIFMGNIHDNSVHQDLLKPRGSSFVASFGRDFIRSKDGWFRPVSQQIGPDGALWIMDWYDKYPCYQNARANPEGVDREHGRIWRAVYVGDKPGRKVPSRPQRGMNLAGLPSKKLVERLAHANVWQRETAQRLLNERRDPADKTALLELLAQGRTLEARLHALWTLHGTGLLDEATLDRCANDDEWALRMWAARLSGERANGSPEVIARLLDLARDEHPSVRLAVATAARQFVSSHLTVNRALADSLRDVDTGDILAALIESSAGEDDPLLPFLIWMAAEPVVVRDPQPALSWLTDRGPHTMPLSGQLAHKVMRRICDTRNREFLDHGVTFINQVLDTDLGLAQQALDGLLEGQKGKALIPNLKTESFLARLRDTGNEALKQRAQRLGALWGDATALQASFDLAANPKAGTKERTQAISIVARLKTEDARKAMFGLLDGNHPEPVTIAAIQALAQIGREPVPGPLIRAWPGLSPAERRTAAEVLVSRHRWQSSLLSALEQNLLPPGDIPPTAVRSLVESKSDFGMLSRRAKQVFGRVQAADKDKAKLIAKKKRMILTMEKEPDLERGHELAKQICFTCHKLHGEGTDIGPDLTGVGRSSLEALLSNIIDPNQIIGIGYENVVVETQDERSISGRMVERSDSRVRILSPGPQEHVIAQSDIASLTISDVSVMPEGLEGLPDEDFRNLVAYILNPPEDQAPFSWKVEKPLSRNSSREFRPIDRESVANWNPRWQIDAPDFEGTPRIHSEYAARKNVLETHPFDRNKPAVIHTRLKIPDLPGSALRFDVASHPKGGWDLKVFIDGKPVAEQSIKTADATWKPVRIDLSPFAGREIEVRIEHHPGNSNWEFARWHNLRLESPRQARK